MGAYMFANPTACHAAAQALPTLTVIHNNALYNAVRRATLDIYATGVAAEADGRFMAELPTPAFEKLMAAHEGYGERVDRPPICRRLFGGRPRRCGVGSRRC